MNPAAIMAEIAGVLAELPGIKSAAGHPVKSVGSTPAVVVGYPDTTYGIVSSEGADRLTVPVLVVLGDVIASATAEKFGAYAGRGTARSVPDALWGKEDWSSCEYARASGHRVEAYAAADKDMLAVTFSVDVVVSN